MMPGAKHMDPVLGVDIHIILIPTPGGPVPTPIPHPFIGMILDPMDYAPIIGSTVLVNGMHRGQAGTAGKCLPPHIPIGGPFQKPPGNESENFLGSATVLVDGEPFTHLVHPALTCNDIGMPPPPRSKKKSKVKSLVLPTSVVMAVPMGPPVLVAGPPTISLMAMGMKLAMAGIGKAFKKLKKMKGKKGKAKKGKAKGGKGDSPSTNKGACEGEHPIDCLTGAVVDDFTDVVVGDERLPFRFIRHYRSSWARHESPIGRGFRHHYMRSLERTASGFHLTVANGDVIEMPPIDEESGESVWSGYTLSAMEGEVGKWYRVERAGEPTMEFDLARGGGGPMRRLRGGGSSCELSYDSGGRLTRLGYSHGLRIEVEHDQGGRIARFIDVQGERRRVISSYEYSHGGELVGRSDAIGGSERYEYEQRHLLTRMVDRVGYGINYEYDEAGRCVKTGGDDGLYAAEYTYHAEAGITIRKFPNGAEWVYMSDENGVGVGIIDPYGGKRTFEVDEDGRVVADIDPNGEVTELVYDDAGKHTHRVNPLGFEEPPVDEEPNPPDCLPMLLPTSPVEWRWGKLLPADRIRAGAHRPTRAGLVASVEGRAERVEPTADRDGLGRVVRAVGEDGAERSWTYDANGNITSFTDADGRTSRTEYHSWNLPRREIDPLGRATIYEHSFHEEITKVTDPGGTVSEFVYDYKDRLIEIRRAGQLKERYEYDAAGNMTRKTDGHGKELLKFTIGPGNLPIRRELATGEVHSLEYGALGMFKKAELEDAHGKSVTELEIDEARRTHKDSRDGMSVEHDWAFGHISATTTLGYTTEFDYDPAQAGVIIDPTGGRHRIFWSNGGTVVRELASGTREMMVHDANGRCVEIIRVRRGEDGGDEERRWAHEVSPEGVVHSIEGPDGVRAFEYDAAGRLTSETREDGVREHFDFDRGGNVVNAPGLDGVRIGQGNRIESANGESLSYNLRQHVATRVGAGVRTKYTYDARDQLVRIDRSSKDGPLAVWTARYDPLGRRISKTIGEGEDAQTTEFLWDEHRLAAEIRPDGSVRVYVYAAAGAMSPCMFVDYDSADADPGSGRVHHVFSDHLGTPVEVEDAAGNVVWKARTGAFGASEIDPSSTIEFNVRWPGHYLDPETGLHYNRFRYYDPTLCRYIQTDPIGLAGGHNTYAYAANPIRDVDLVGWAHRGNNAGTKGNANKAGGADAEAPSAKLGDSPENIDAVAKKAGMDPDHVRNLQKHCKDNNRMVVMRAGNEAQIPHIKNPDMSPKPVTCKLNTAKTGKNKGLVTTGQSANPDTGVSKWKPKSEGGKGYSDEYGKMKEDGWSTDNGVIKDPQGKPVHGDYDMQGVYDKNPDGPGYSAPKDANGKPYDGGTNDPDFQKDLNKDLNGDPYDGPKDKDMVQHGANDDFKKSDGSMGRNPEPDESYLVTKPDGSTEVVNGTDNLKKVYDDEGIPWPY